MLKRLRVGIVGCGWAAQNFHIPNYIKNPKSELVALCDINEKVLGELSNKYGIKYTLTDYRELFGKSIIDAVSICTPTRSHCEIVIDAADHGIHTLCEKPIASTIEEADKMVEAVANSNIKFVVGFNFRFLPNHRKMKEYLLSGKIGKPIFVRGELVAAGPYKNDIPKDTVEFETQKRMGVFFDLGAHIADLFIWMLGKPREVSAFFSTHRKGIHVDDSASILIKFESGVIGNITTSWVNLLDFQAIANSRMIEIIGERGIIGSDFFGPSLYFYSKNSLTSKIKGKLKITPSKFNPKIPNEAFEWSYRQEIENFLNSIIKDKEPTVSGEEAREALKLVLAAYESNRTKSTIKLE